MSAAGQAVTALATPVSAARLRVYLLGSPRVEWADRALAIRRRQVRALLYRLATRFEPADRDQLCFLFWPDAPDSEARRNLTHLLTHLRRALPAPELIWVVDDQIGLDPRGVWSDVAAFEQLCAPLLPPSLYRDRGPVQQATKTQALEGAVDLYQGLFLAGISLPDSPEFEAWADRERRNLERLYLEALTILIEKLTPRGRHEAAIEYAQRYLATDELAEDVHRSLIELYALAGDRGAAQRQFELCAAVLERELGVSPLPQTRAAYQAALRGEPVAEQPLPPASWTILPSLYAPLVGRDEALSRLEHAYYQAQSGNGGLFLISGEPGIGKSRLMQDFVAGLRGRATLVCGSGYETEQGLPFWALVEALRPHLPTTDWAALGVETVYLTEVARLLPELRTCLRDLPFPPSVEPEHEHLRLFQALVRLFLGLAAHQPPLVLCLDNLHWVDRTTLSWLAYLMRHLDAAPVLVLTAYRTEHAPMVKQLWAGLVQLGLVHEIALEGLPPQDVVHLVRYLSGQSSGAELFSQRLHRETGGNPFFLLETLRAMFEAGILWQDEGGWSTGVDELTEDYGELPLPYTLSQAIRDRLDRLSPQTYQVLEAGAVLGHVFSLHLVHRTSGRREDQVVDALDTLVARHILTELGGRYRFNHDLIRTVVYRDLSYGRRRLLHRRAGETFEKLGPGDLATLARHFERAEEHGRAAEYALRAGQAARAVFAYDEARAYFDRALAYLEQEAMRLQAADAMEANRRLRIEVLDGRGWAFRLLGDMDAYSRDSQEVARLAGLLGDQRTLAHLRWREAYTHRWFCRYAQAREAAEAGCHLAQKGCEPLVEAMCWREVGLTARATGHYGRALAALERALALFVQEGAIVHEIHALGNLSTLCLLLGECQRALDLSRRALARCDAAGLPFERRLPLGDMGAAAAALGDAGLAQESLRESLAIARQIADRTQEILCLGHLGWLCNSQKQPVEALRYLGQALDLAARIGSLSEQSWLLSGLAKAHHLMGDQEQAAEHALRALALAQAQGRAYDQEQARRVMTTLERLER